MMNDRIRELAKQAGYMEDMFGIGHWDMPECRKFAELIIKECMLQCIKVENDVELSDYEGEFKDGSLLCYQAIQEHFEVK